jgi:hypothetical protein
MVHCGGSVFHWNGFPGFAAKIEIEYYGRRLCGYTIHPNAAVVVDGRAASGEIGFVVSIGTPPSAIRYRASPGCGGSLLQAIFSG